MSLKQSNLDILLEHGLDIRGRVLYLQGDVDKELIHQFIRKLKFLDKSPGDITIVLDSEGGDVNLGLATYDAITKCDNEVTISVEGVAMSMGSIILQAGDKRTISKHSRVMIHRGSTSMEGNFTDVERAMKENKELDKMCIDIYHDRITDKNPDFKRSRLDKMMDFDTYISAEEAVELGLADEID